MRSELSGVFDMVLTEVARDNPRSLKVGHVRGCDVACTAIVCVGNSEPVLVKAHINVGFEVVSTSSFDGVEFDIVCWRWR
jgi:hypothetical protein